jgi:hypothetical protein
MSVAVNLLLLLSALLSALTGVQAGARAPQAVVSVSQSAEAISAVSASCATVAGRPVFALPRLNAIAAAGAQVAWRLPTVTPLFASRRRE